MSDTECDQSDILTKYDIEDIDFKDNQANQYCISKTYHPELSFWNKVKPYKLNSECTLIGYSTASRYTSFWIPEKRIMLDAGVVAQFTPEHIFITHGHYDHCGELPRLLIDNGKVKPKLYVPKAHQSNIYNYIDTAYKMTKFQKETNIHTQYDMISVLPDVTINTTIKSKEYLIEIIKCNHSVPTDGYGFIEVRSKLKSEYVDLSQEELTNLKKNGTDITTKIQVPIFCFMGDTDHKVLTNKSLEQYPVVIIECTFLDQDHVKEAKKTKHMHWNNLKQYIIDHPATTYILIHFSARYDDIYVKNFFKDMQKTIKNIVIWI